VGRWRSLAVLAAGLAPLAACNGLLGNDGVSLFTRNGDGGHSDATSKLGPDSSAKHMADGGADARREGGPPADAGRDSTPDSGRDTGKADAVTCAPGSCPATTPYCSTTGSCSATPPQCSFGGPGLTDCGDGTDNCCASSIVDGGTFYRTYSNSDGGGPTGEADPATISNVRLDEYEVTVGRFRAFAAYVSAGYYPPPGSGKHTHLAGGQGLMNAETGTYELGWDSSNNQYVNPSSANLTSNCGEIWGDAGPAATWTSGPTHQDRLPINCVNWWEAYAFCIWDGGFLPSLAEREYAGAGGSMQLAFPWGNTPPGSQNLYAIYGCYFDAGTGVCQGLENIAPVGTAKEGPGLWGQMDLAGSVWEWDLDTATSLPSPCTDCASLTPGTYTSFLGGTYDSPATSIEPGVHAGDMPSSRYSRVGVRCARTP